MTEEEKKAAEDAARADEARQQEEQAAAEAARAEEEQRAAEEREAAKNKNKAPEGDDDAEALRKELEKTQNRIKELNKENEKRRHQLKDWEELQNSGVDPNTVKTLLQERKDAERKKKEEEGRYRELLEEIETQTAAEKEQIKSEADQKLSVMQKNLEKYFVDKEIAEAVSAEGASLKLLSKHVKEHVKMVEEDGEFKTIVVDAKGEPRLKRGGSYFTVSDLLAEMKGDEEFAKAFPAPSTSGGGSNSNATKSASSPSAAAKAGLQRGKMSPQEKYNFQKEHGMDAYLELPI